MSFKRILISQIIWILRSLKNIFHYVWGEVSVKFMSGYRKGYNTQYVLIALLEMWKQSLDYQGYVGAMVMDLC